MRYIHKSTGCTQFAEWFAENQPSCWDVPTDVKHALHNHLWREQQGLCVYCQQAIPEKKTAQSSAQIRSHIEHIRPRKDYKKRMFDYDNLSISCQGFDCTATAPQKKEEFCGHRRKDKYDENQFLHPFELQDIEDYFEYDVEGRIFANHLRSQTDQQKANYMIKILALDHKELNRLREANYLQLIQEDNGDINELLNPNYPLLPAFYPMLSFLLIEQHS